MSDDDRPGEYLIPALAKSVECKSCGAAIVWTKTSKNGKPIPLSMATVRTGPNGARYALAHFADCPHAARHRAPKPVTIDALNLFDYLDQHGLIVTGSTISDDGAGCLVVTLQTRKAA